MKILNKSIKDINKISLLGDNNVAMAWATTIQKLCLTKNGDQKIIKNPQLPEYGSSINNKKKLIESIELE